MVEHCIISNNPINYYKFSGSTATKQVSDDFKMSDTDRDPAFELSAGNSVKNPDKFR